MTDYRRFLADPEVIQGWKEAPDQRAQHSLTLSYFGPDRHADWCRADPAHVGFCLDLFVEAVVAGPDQRSQPMADDICEVCGRKNVVWFTNNALWNLVMGGPEAKDDPGGLLCPMCFIDLAEAAGVTPTAWALKPSQPMPDDPHGIAARVVDAIEKLADACVLYPAPGSMAARQKAKQELFDALTEEPADA